MEERKKFDWNEYNYSYKKQNYDTFTILLPKGSKEKIKEVSKHEKLSISQLIKKALEKVYKIKF